MTENLNCKTCNQNVMVSGLKSVNNEWKCRDCIKRDGTNLQNVDSIGQFDLLEKQTKIRNEAMEKYIQENKTKLKL